MVIIDFLIMFTFFVAVAYYHFDNGFVRIYVVLYFSILIYSLIKILITLLNKK